ncbi:trypsin-like cysteine/serine peptidase domain-containing protein [Syncephalis plumigaleata]|nr:trypsin-like cysteine/serine peptidase domain-containing protein [Syncephalis plumigaleata]
MPPSFKGMISFVLLAALLPASTLAAAGQSTGLRVHNKGDAIYGGSAVLPEKYPFMAGIYERGNVSCGAAIIAPTWIITAAHCIVVPDSSPGVGSVSNITKYPITIKRAVISPVYNVNDNTNDIALIELNTSLTYNSTVQPIRISSGRNVDLQIAPDAECRKGYPDWGGQNSELVCTVTRPPNAGSYALLALTSFGINVLNPTSTECGGKGASNSLYYRGATTAGLLVGPTAIIAMLLTVIVSGFF